MDIAELDRLGTPEEFPGQPTDIIEPPKLLENGKPAWRAELCIVFSGAGIIGLSMLPYRLKKGQHWYSVMHSSVLFSMTVSIVCLFYKNTHIKMLRFLSGKMIFVQVVILALIDWLRVMILPGQGWEVTDRIVATTTLAARLAFICLDSLTGISRWFRLFIAFFFITGNFYSIFAAYFLDAAQSVLVISATNTTITTSAIKASVGTTLTTLTAAMLVTIWQDKHFQYSALYRSYLPKLAVETVGVEPGSVEMHEMIEQRATAVAAWRGWPRKAAVVILVAIAVFLFSIVLSTTELKYDVDGRASMAVLALRASALILGCVGSCVFLFKNVNWRRFKYTLSSVQGILWMFYTLIYACAGLAQPISTASSVFRTVCASLGLLFWLLFEAVQQISRVMHISITFTLALTLAVTIYLTAYVWDDDVVLGDLNGVENPGVVTRYSIQRMCFINLLLLMAGSLVKVVTKNLSDNGFFVLVSGNVLRRDIMEVESLSNNPEGDNDFIVENSLMQRLSQHQRLSQ
jgi:hypothetical protein